jgi:hypothetical protein
MFGILDPSVSGWQEMSQLVPTMQGTEGTQTLPQQTEDTIIQGFMLADKTPLVKIATPQTSPDRTLCSGYYANSQRLARVNTAAYQAVTNTTKMRAKDPALPQVHVDLSGHKPTIPLLANVESDLVYLQHWQPFVLGAGVWEMIGAYRAKQIERGGTPPELPLASPGQTENIQHLLLAHETGKYRRSCLGCRKLTFHCQQLTYLSDKRARSRADRAKRSCKMCKQVQQQVQLEGDSADEAAIRERLLKERMLALVPRVQHLCASRGYELSQVLYEVSYYWPPEESDLGDDGAREDDDAVSICSNDANDDFAWYNNSRHALAIETIPFPAEHGTGEEVPSSYLDIPIASSATQLETDPFPIPPLATTAATALPSLSPSHYRPRPTTPDFGHPLVSALFECLQPRLYPRHGTHPDCNRIQIENDFEEEIPYFFPSAKSLLFLDRGITLREGVTTLPSKGRRWYTGDGRGVYVEVADPEDERWVIPTGHHTSVWGGGGEDLVGVVELVRYLRAFYEKRFSSEDGLSREEEGRRIEVGIVAYLELDEEGNAKVDSNREDEGCGSVKSDGGETPGCQPM